jgi:CRP-like cAMP-binding protein
MLRGDGSVAEVDSRRLRTIPLLRPLSDAQLEALSQQFVCERAAPGQHIIREGERSDLFYLIVRGMVTVTRQGPDEQPLEVTRLGEGDEFGEMALLFDSPRNATVTARTDCLLLTLTRQQFLELVQETSDLRARIEAVAAQRGADPALRLQAV